MQSEECGEETAFALPEMEEKFVTHKKKIYLY